MEKVKKIHDELCFNISKDSDIEEIKNQMEHCPNVNYEIDNINVIDCSVAASLNRIKFRYNLINYLMIIKVTFIRLAINSEPQVLILSLPRHLYNVIRSGVIEQVWNSNTQYGADNMDIAQGENVVFCTR